MTDPRAPRDPELPPLEPWAREIDASAQDPTVEHELRQVVGLLRDLPDPEPPPNLAGRVLTLVAEERSRPPLVWRAIDALRGWMSPPVALAAAAALCAVAVVPSLPSLFPSADPGTGSRVALEQPPTPTIVAGGVGRELRAGAGLRPAPTRRPPATIGRPQFVSMLAQAPASPPVRSRIARDPVGVGFDRQLDRQLNQLMLDPASFVSRLERISQREQFVSRLAERAAQRGDATEIALRVRELRHPMATEIVNRMLRATLLARASKR